MGVQRASPSLDIENENLRWGISDIFNDELVVFLAYGECSVAFTEFKCVVDLDT